MAATIFKKIRKKAKKNIKNYPEDFFEYSCCHQGVNDTLMAAAIFQKINKKAKKIIKKKT